MGAPMIFIWVTWRLMVFLAQHVVHLMFEKLHPTLGWHIIWLKNIIIGRNILWCYMMIYIFMSVLMRLLWATWSLQCFLCSLFGSYFGRCSWFTSWMKENMADYIDVHYIFLEQHYRTWDPHLCHWSRFYIIHDACVYGPHDDLLTQMYKNFHNYLMR